MAECDVERVALVTETELENIIQKIVRHSSHIIRALSKECH